MSELQLFNALAPHIEDALRASIRRFGVLSPVTRDQHGRILDGHHRVRIAGELGMGIADDVIIHVEDDDEAREIARTLNSDRRHLTEEQRRLVAADLRREGHSLRAIAGALSTSKDTVARDLAGVSRETPEQPERVKGMDGKSYAATRPAPEPEPPAEPAPDLLAGDDWVEPEPDLVPLAAPKPEPARPAARPRVDVSRAVLIALTDLRQARDALQALTPEQLARQDGEARRTWTARLNEELEALHGFRDLLTQGD